MDNKNDLYCLCRDLFFPFQTHFFKEQYPSESELSSSLQEISGLFQFSPEPERLSKTQPDSPDEANLESSFDQILSLQTPEENRQPLRGFRESVYSNDILQPKAGLDKGKSGRIKQIEKEEHDIASAIDTIIGKYNELMAETSFNRESLDRWLLFHRNLIDLSVNPHCDASIVLAKVYEDFQKKIEEENTDYSIWLYGERAFWAHYDTKKPQNYVSKTNYDMFCIVKDAIKEILRVRKNPVNIIYYTSLNTLKHLFDNDGTVTKRSDSCFSPSIMSVSTMNDPEEGHFLQSILSDDTGRRHRYWWDDVSCLDTKMQQRYYCIEPFVFCKSFADLNRKDDLSMWEIYGDRAEGCCCEIVIHHNNKNPMYYVAYLTAKDEISSAFPYKVVQIGGEKESAGNESFVPQRIDLLNICLQLLKECIDSLQKELEQSFARSTEEVRIFKDDIRKGIMEITYLFKDASYSHENELRYLDSFPDENDIVAVGGSREKKELPLLSVKSKVEFSYKEVILGPKIKKPDLAAAYLKYQFGRFLEEKNKDKIPFITKSAIQYR